MKYDRVDSTLKDKAIQIQNSIFTGEHGDDDIISSVEGNVAPYFSFLEYYLVKVNGEYVGICGLYEYREYPDDVWLGWYGVLDKYRQLGYGKHILKDMISLAKSRGYKALRLYTDDVANSVAVQVYTKAGMTSEEYINPKDKYCKQGNTLIFSISLDNTPISKWDNKYLYLGDHDKRNGIKK